VNILQVLPELKVGGVETGTVDFARYLVKNGHKAVVVSYGGDLVNDLEEAGVIHYKLPVHEKSIFTIIKMVKELSLIIRKENIDIVHARSRVPGLIAFFACRNTGTVFLTTCHGYYSKHLLSKVMAYGKLVIVPSNVIGRHMIDDFGVHPKRIRLIARSVDLDKFVFSPYENRPKTGFIVGMIGRITPLKGHAYFLKAIAKIIRSMPYLKVWIVGDAPESKQIYREEVQTLARRLGISHCVQFLGNRKDIPQIISKLNIVVLSTVTEEAFGRVIIESQACGTPVVATRVGGVVDVVEDGVTGLLVAPKDPDAMAAAILKLLKDKALVEKLTLNARKNVEENFIIEKMSTQTLAAYEEAASIKNILVIKIGAIGDVILAIPSIRALRKKFPEARIYCLVGKESRSILQRCPYLNGIIVFDHKEKDRGIFGLFNILKEVRKYYFDMVIDLQNNRKSHLISYFSMSADRYGYNNRKLSFLLNHKVEPAQTDTPAVEHQFRTLKLLDIDKENLNLELWPSEEDDEYIRILLESEWIGQKEKIVGINLGASKRWLSKCWPLENFAQLCDKLSKDSIRVIITGTQEDLNSAAKIQKLASSKLLNFAGKTTIMQLAALIKRCSVFVSADSAPLHVAASVGTPMVALFGPTSPDRHMPPAKIAVAIKKDVACSPCYKPNCKSMECMRQISVEEVYRTVKSLLVAK